MTQAMKTMQTQTCLLLSSFELFVFYKLGLNKFTCNNNEPDYLHTSVSLNFVDSCMFKNDITRTCLQFSGILSLEQSTVVMHSRF